MRESAEAAGGGDYHGRARTVETLELLARRFGIG
jgi:hypothetical protein